MRHLFTNGYYYVSADTALEAMDIWAHSFEPGQLRPRKRKAFRLVPDNKVFNLYWDGLWVHEDDSACSAMEHSMRAVEWANAFELGYMFAKELVIRHASSRNR